MKTLFCKTLLAILVAAVLEIAGNACRAATIVNSNVIFSGGLTSSSFRLFQDAPATDFTVMNFTRSDDWLSFLNITLDEGSEWYFTNLNNVFSAATVEQGLFTAFNTSSNLPGPPYFVGYRDFYLAMSTGRGPGQNGKLPRTVFGWVEMRNTPSGLTMLRSAITYDQPGIVVGTTTTVPEPGAVSLLGIAGGLMGGRRLGRSRK